MDHATRRHAAGGSLTPYAHSEPLAKAIELLLIKLPDADAPVRRPRTPLPARVRKLLASEVAQIIDAYQGGSTVGQLAVQFGIDRETVRRILNQSGLPRHPRGLTAEQVDQAVTLYAGGMILARIGARFGVDAKNVRRWLIETGVRCGTPMGGPDDGDATDLLICGPTRWPVDGAGWPPSQTAPASTPPSHCMPLRRWAATVRSAFAGNTAPTTIPACGGAFTRC
jgi:hypothetical protein